MRVAICSVCVGVLSGCFASVTSVAHDMFTSDHDCPNAEETVADDGTVDVVGCGRHEEFKCTAGFNTGHRNQRTYPTTCSYRTREAYVASDGTQKIAWSGEGRLVYETAIASAAHDLPCAPSSITEVDELTLEGCGQRVTYRAVPLELYRVSTDSNDFRVTDAYRYLLVARVPLKSPPPVAPTK